MPDVGYGKPPKHTQFKPGQTGNPGGKTSEQKRLELENAERAIRIRSKGLVALETLLEGMSEAEITGILLDAQALKLLKDSEDRGLGAPVQSMDVKMNLGSALDELPDD